MTSQNTPRTVSNPSFPQSIILDKWEDAGFSWEGEVTPMLFPRLLELVDTNHRKTAINLCCKLEKRDNVTWLSMSFDGALWVICQRCLQPLDIELDYEEKLALLYDESQSSLLDDEIDYVLLDEVISTQQHQRLLPLAELVEDELLLNVPLSAKHEDCEMMVAQVGDIPEDEESDNPFAVLAGLKEQLSE
ncbi:YceD family protein [Psychrobacter sp. I-STPA10]|uniref:YceD family protein n=1 Tax=Psychrobacter sp. I-STPA10 TaxID=2585769 RepID=UPI001E5F1801|nr:YceD family protein [Psychrobacter sp. I-STPA10]